MEEERVTLMSNDREIVKVTKKAILMSETIKNLIEDIGCKEDDPIPLGNLDAKTLKKIVEFCEHYSTTNPPTVEEIRESKIISGWELEFLNIPIEQLLELILGADYMAIGVLVQLCALHIANFIKGNNREKIKLAFGVTRDFTAEEEAEARNDPSWVDDPTLKLE